MDQSPIVGTIVVTHQTPRGVLAQVDGQTRSFPDLDSVFREAVERLERKTGHVRRHTSADDRQTTA